MTKRERPTKELSRVARDYFGFKALAGTMGAATLLPYFIPFSLPAVVAWIFLYKRDLARYGKRGIVLYYLAPAFALIGGGLAFLGAEWRLTMSTIYYISIFSLLPIREPSRPAELWNDEADVADVSSDAKRGSKVPSSN